MFVGHPEVLEPPPPKRPKRLSALRHSLLHPDHVAGADEDLFDDGDLMDADKNADIAAEFELDGDDDDWSERHESGGEEEDDEMSEYHDTFRSAAASRDLIPSPVKIRPPQSQQQDEPREQNGPDHEMVRQSIESLSKKLPLVTRWLRTPDFVVVVGFVANRYFAGKGGWNYIDLDFNVNGIPMTHSEFRTHMNSTSTAGFTLGCLECFGILDGVIGWHKYTEWLPTAVRQGHAVYDAERLTPLKPAWLTPQEAQWFAALEPNDTLQDPIEIKAPIAMNLAASAAAITKQLPAPVKGCQSGDAFGIIFSVEPDWRTLTLRFRVDLHGKVVDLREVAAQLQPHPTAERLYVWGKVKGAREPSWIRIKEWCNSKVRRGKAEFLSSVCLVSQGLSAEMLEIMKAHSDGDLEKIERLRVQARRRGKSPSKGPNSPVRRKSAPVEAINDDLEDITLTLDKEPHAIVHTSPPPRIQAPPPAAPKIALRVVYKPSDTVFQTENHMLECDCGSDLASFAVTQDAIGGINSHLSLRNPAWAHIHENVFDGAHIDEILMWLCCKPHSTATRVCLYSSPLLRRLGPTAHRLVAWREYIDYIISCRRQLSQLVWHSFAKSQKNDASGGSYDALQQAIETVPRDQGSPSSEAGIIAFIKLLCEAEKYEAAASIMKLWESELEWRSKHMYRCNQCESHYLDERYCQLCGNKAELSTPTDRPTLRNMVMQAVGYEAVAKLFTML
jgi:hypothetical protein